MAEQRLLSPAFDCLPVAFTGLGRGSFFTVCVTSKRVPTFRQRSNVMPLSIPKRRVISGPFRPRSGRLDRDEIDAKGEPARAPRSGRG